MADFPFIKPPKKYLEILGEREPGTRLYKAYGDQLQYQKWVDAVFDICIGGAVSPGGAAIFAKVSRAGVHKRLKEGRLTGFFFYMTKKGLFGKDKLQDYGRPTYGYVAVSECKAWYKELVERAQKGERAAVERELAGDGDHEGKMLNAPEDWANKKKKGG